VSFIDMKHKVKRFDISWTVSFFASACLLWSASLSAQADNVDDFVAAQMRDHGIVGLSLAIIDDGKIIKARGYGFTDKSGKTPITTSTLFQAGSVSKSVAALGALRLVEQGQLALDEDVNAKLQTWKVPENEFTKDEKVTLRRLLSHSAGLTVHGFPGYAVGSPVPTLVQVLDGEKPANTPAIRVDCVPGSQWRYAGGGYTVMQQLLIDVTGQPFPEFMQKSVLKPLGMAQSTYAQPLAQRHGHNDAGRLSRERNSGRRPLAHLPGNGRGRLMDYSFRPSAFRHRHPAISSWQIQSRRLSSHDSSDAHRSEGWRRFGSIYYRRRKNTPFPSWRARRGI
jgi:CubicO group peptidase (beta-lactamase class C family)